MDFASLMKNQISKSKPSTTSEVSKSKYLRRADLEAARQAEYAAEQARIEAEREERLAKKRKLDEEETERERAREDKKRKLAEESKLRREEEEAKQERLRRKRLGLPELPQNSEPDGNDTPLPDGNEDIPDTELQSKLRALDQPAILFDESHTARLARHHNLVNLQQHPPPATPKQQQLSKTPIPTTIPLLPESDLLIPTTLPPITTPPTPALTHLHAQLSSYFTLLLREWSLSLSTRSPTTKSSSTGLTATRTYHSVLTDLTPLFRRLESLSLPSSLLTPICEIVRHAQTRRYVDANDAYLRLSIGKAAWPIGVTMVGIHERSAREKLHGGAGGDDKEAHIMADEVTRKMLQSIKRCLSYAQVRWPPEDLGQLMG